MTTPNQSTLELLRQKVGLQANDASKDQMIIVAWQGAYQWLEVYLDRFLDPDGVKSEVFTHVTGGTISLKGYPLQGIVSITDVYGNDITAYHYESTTGLIHFDGHVVSHELSVDYYMANPVTGPLWLAVVQVFDQVWAGMQATGGAAALGAGVVKAVTSDGARVEYFDPSSGGDSAVGIDPGSGLPAATVAMLAPYKREYA